MIYFVCSSARVKIGYTSNLGTRLTALRTGSAVPLELLAVCLGGKEVETAYHKRYARFRLQGEWFKITPSLLNHVATFGPAADQKLLRRLRRAHGYTVAKGAHLMDCAEDSDRPAEAE